MSILGTATPNPHPKPSAQAPALPRTGVTAPNARPQSNTPTAPVTARPLPGQASPAAPVSGIRPMSRQAERAGIMDVSFEIAVNNMLAQPHTLILNASSNAFQAAGSMVDNAFRTITSAFNAPESRTRVSEVFYGTYGYFDSFMSSFKFIGDQLYHPFAKSTEQSLADAGLMPELGRTSRIEGEPRMRYVSSEGMGMDPSTLTGKLADGLGAIVNAPGSMLYGMDIIFKNGQVNQLLFGRAARMVANGKAPDMATARTALLQDENFRKEAVHLAEKNTFMNRAEMPSLAWVTDHRYDMLPGFRWVVPFKRSIASILEQTFERSPLVLMSPTLSKKLISANADERATAQARLLTGMTMMAGLSYAFRDNLTGVAPLTPKDRAMWEEVNIRENSIVFRDNALFNGQHVAIELDNLGVYGQFLKALARYDQWVSNMPEHKLYERGSGDEITDLQKEFIQMVDPVVSMLYDQYWAKNVTEFASKVTDWVKNDDPSAMLGWLSRMGVKMVPVYGAGWVKYHAQMDDPFKHKSSELWHYFAEQSNEWSEKVPYSYSWDGRKILASRFKGDGRHQFAYNEYNPNDPLQKFMSKIGVKFNEPNDFVEVPPIIMDGQQVVPGQPVKLTPEEWTQFNEYRYTGIPGLMPPVRDVVKEFIDMDFFKLNLLPYQQAVLISGRVNDYNRQVMDFMNQEGTDLNRRYMRAIAKRDALMQQDLKKMGLN